MKILLGMLIFLSGCGYSLLLGGGFVAEGVNFSQTQNVVEAIPSPSPTSIGAAR